MADMINLKTIQDEMRKDEGVDGDAQRIGQLTWMLFLKIYDDKEKEWELKDDYKSPIPKAFRWRNWAADAEGITGETLIKFVNNELFEKLKNLPVGKNPQAAVVKSVFEDTFNYMKSGQQLRKVLNHLEKIDFNNKEQRVSLGDLYESFLSDLQSAGNAGEYYTPRAVVKFMVDRVNPTLEDTVLDPACGTGGFLAAATDHIRSKYVKNIKDERKLQALIQGVEKKQLPHLLCITNLIMHGIETPSAIKRDNTLSRPLVDWGPADRVDVILTNPPFGGMEEDGIEQNFPASYRTRETADLFLQLIMKRLKPGGRAAVVLPDGTLFGEGVKTRIKEQLLTDCNLHTIVRLPNGVFSPYTGIKTNLLFFTKGEKTKDVWYYEHPYPEGVKTYNKTKPMRFEEFAPEQKWWNKRQENEQAWKVSLKDIAARNYNLDIKNPHSPELNHGDPEELLAEYRAAEKAAAEARAALKKALMEALSR